MEAMYKLQNNSQILIGKAEINFKKTPKDRVSRTYVETRLESLEVLWKEFSSIHKSIIQCATDAQRESDKYFVNEVYDATEETYIFHKAHLKEVLNRLSDKSLDQNAKTNVNHTMSNSVTLPKINIPKFSGNYAEWTTFKDLFTSLIHSNNSLEDVQKLYYLKGLLSGEADQLVRHIAVTSDNYRECWSLLHSRYNNKRFLSNCLLKRLLSQSNASECSSSLKSLLDTTMECLNGLKNLGVDVSTWDSIIIFIISSKLDYESRKQWETKIGSKDELPMLSEFRDFLETRFRALEFLDDKSSRPKPKVHHIVSNDDKAVAITCPFCNENHKIANCKKFAQESYETRHNFAQTRRLCYNCLNANHSIKFCRQTTSCRICQRRHHSLIHPNPGSNSTIVKESSNKEFEVKAAVAGVQASSSESEPLTSNIVSHFSKGSKVPNQVLLATALVEAQTRSGSTQMLRVLLDQGSQASFIAESAVQLLGLRKNRTKSVLSGIGGERSAFASKYTVTMTIHSRLNPNFSVQVHAFVLRDITSLLPLKKLEQSYWPQLKNLVLADPEFHTPSKIDLLLGAEIYSKVLRDGLIQGPPDQPLAQNTALGWILSGQVPSSSSSIHCHHVVHSSSYQADDNALLQRFGEVESTLPDKRIVIDEEQQCEDIYAQSHSEERFKMHLTKEEIQEATKTCIIQKQELSEEMKDIKITGSVKARSKFKSLCPVIDDDGILCVSGHIHNADLDEAVKHPIILPPNSHFTNLVIDEAHKETLHGGPTLKLSQLRTRYWIPSAKVKIKAHVHKCVKGRRYSASIQTPLTPGHLLIGEPLIAVPERSYETANISNLRRWQVTQRMLQDFWSRWSEEYVVYLMQRYKWTKKVPEPNIGDIVFIKQDGLPPARWLFGRVVSKHPGLDKVTRVVTLKCKGSLIRLPTSKLCILPVAIL